MKTLMTKLETLNFTKQTGLSGLSNGDIAVSLEWTKEAAMVYVNEEMVFHSSNEDEIIAFVKAELSKKDVSKTNDQHDAEVLAAEVAKDSEMKYYTEEDNRGKAELIKNALSSLNEKLPKSIKMADFQKLVESHLNAESKTEEASVVKYVSTNGLVATHEHLSKPVMVKVWFAVMSDDTVRVTVESANTGAQLTKLGTKIITRDELRDMPEDAYDDMVFNRAAFKMMGLSI